MMSNKTVYLYTLPLCPKCKVLKKKLEQQNIEYIEIVNSEDLTIEGIVDFPVLETLNGIRYSFEEAVEWLKSI